jgi:hypothetical protein
MATLGP